MKTFILILAVASLARFAIGGIWYMPKGLFGKKWLELQGVDASASSAITGKKPMAYGFAVTIVSTYVLLLFLSNYAMSAPHVVLITFLIWVGFVLPMLLQRKIYDVNGSYSWQLLWIDSSYELAGLLAAAAAVIFLA